MNHITSVKKSLAVVTVVLLVAASFIYFGNAFLAIAVFGQGYPWDGIGWQMVYIDGFGSFKVPGDLYVSEKDGYIYITNAPMSEDTFDIYMVEATFSKELGMPLPPKDVADNILPGEPLEQMGNFSNATVYYHSYEYQYDGISSTKFSLHFTDDTRGEECYFLCWDDEINFDTLREIGQSFRWERERRQSYIRQLVLFLPGLLSLVLFLVVRRKWKMMQKATSSDENNDKM